MRRLVSTVLTGIVAVVLLAGSGGRAEAMNNEAAALLAGAIAVFGPPILFAATARPVYAEPYPVVVYERHYHPVPAAVMRVRTLHRDCVIEHRHVYDRGRCIADERHGRDHWRHTDDGRFHREY